MDLDYDDLPQKKILCLDMKSFYASVEAVSRGLDPLKTLLVVVGNKERSGSVVLAASPKVKEEYNIKTANRYYEVPKDGSILVVEPRMELYLNKSMEVLHIFNQFVPFEAVHVYSIDEAWLNLEGTEHLFGNMRETAEKIRRKILEDLGLPLSIGAGPNMFLSKVAMDIKGKKVGFAEWNYEDVSQKLWPVELEKCWGIGKKTAARLHRVGAKTVGDLAHLPLNWLEREFGIIGNQLYYHAWGVDLSSFDQESESSPKSLTKGITLWHDYKEYEHIETVILELCEEVTRRARARNLFGRTVSLRLGYSREQLRSGFRIQKSISTPTNLTGDVYEVCRQILDENYRGEWVRKISVSLGNFISDAALQLNLFRDKEKEYKLAMTMDAVRDKYDSTALMWGRSLKKEAVTMDRSGTIGGHRA